MPELDSWLWLLLLIPAYYLVIPVIVGLQQRYPATPIVTELKLEELEKAHSEFLMTQTNALFALGFDEPTLVRLPALTPVVSASAYLIMLVNRQAGDKAMVTAMVTSHGLVKLQTLYLEFCTNFEGGEEFNTHNIPRVLALPPAPLAVRTQVPMVEDPRELHQLHKFVMRKHDATGKKIMYEPGQALEHLIRCAFTKQYKVQVERGWMYYDQKSDHYRITLRGAYRITWGLMQPFKALRAMALKRRAKRILEEFHEACGPEPTKLES
jgi:hypothetical protein